MTTIAAGPTAQAIIAAFELALALEKQASEQDNKKARALILHANKKLLASHILILKAEGLLHYPPVPWPE